MLRDGAAGVERDVHDRAVSDTALDAASLTVRAARSVLDELRSRGEDVPMDIEASESHSPGAPVPDCRRNIDRVAGMRIYEADWILGGRIDLNIDLRFQGRFDLTREVASFELRNSVRVKRNPRDPPPDEHGQRFQSREGGYHSSLEIEYCPPQVKRCAKARLGREIYQNEICLLYTSPSPRDRG